MVGGRVTASVLRLLAKAVEAIAPRELETYVAALPSGFRYVMVPRREVDAAWERALSRTGHPALGLAIGAQVSPEVFGLFGLRRGQRR